MKRVLGLDFLRALAIALVFLSHAEKLITSNYAVSPVFHFLGYQGVELFFVLSGFLIGRILFRNPVTDWKKMLFFFQRRWLRTLPAFVVALAVNIFFSKVDYTSILKVGTFTGNFFPFQTEIGLPFFTITWTLAVEEWFYILFPLLLLIFGSSMRTVLIIWCALIIFRILYSVYAIDISYDVLRSTVILRLDAILIGVIMSIIAAKIDPIIFVFKKTLRIIYFCSLVLGGFIWIYFPFIQYTSMTFSALFMPINSIFLGLIVWDFSLISRPFNFFDRITAGLFRKIVTYLSLISYSFYLYHLLILNWIINLKFVVWQGFIFSLTLTILASSVSYYLIERPFVKIRDIYFPKIKLT